MSPSFLQHWLFSSWVLQRQYWYLRHALLWSDQSQSFKPICFSASPWLYPQPTHFYLFSWFSQLLPNYPFSFYFVISLLYWGNNNKILLRESYFLLIKRVKSLAWVDPTFQLGIPMAWLRGHPLEGRVTLSHAEGIGRIKIPLIRSILSLPRIPVPWNSSLQAHRYVVI